MIMVSMCLLGDFLLDYYGKTMLWSWCLCVFWGLYYWIIMGRLYCGHVVYVSTGGSSTGLLWEDYVVVMVFMCLLGGSTIGLLWEDYVVVMVSMCLLGALLLDYYGKTMLWSWCQCVYWGLYYWIIMGRLCCGHGAYVSTGDSSTGLLWEVYVVVLVSMCLLGLYYWNIMRRLCCGHGVYMSTEGSTIGLLWEECVVVMVSMCLLGALLLDYYGKTMLWSWCLCVYWGLYYWIIMGRLYCGHGVHVSTGGSTTGLLCENYVVVMVSMFLLGALLLDYYGKTVLWSWCLCVYWGLFYWIIMGRLCCGHGVYVSTGGLYYWIIMGRLCCGHGVYVSTWGSTTGLLWEDYVVVMVSMCLLGALLLDYYGKTVMWSWCLCVYWGLFYWIIMGSLCCGHGVYVTTGGSTTGLLMEDYVVVMVSMCLLGALLLDYYGKTVLWSWCLCVYWGLFYWIIMGRLCCGHGVYVSTGGSFTGLLWEDCCDHGVYVSNGGFTTG